MLGTALMLLVLGGNAEWASADSGMVGLWHLDDGVGVIAADSSGQENDGTLTGGVTWVPGRFGTALGFDGVASSVRVPDSPSLEPAAAVTVSAWVRHQGSPGTYRYIVAKGATGCIAASYAIYTGPGGGVAFYVSTGHGLSVTLSPSQDGRIWDGNWHYLVGTFDGASVRLYVDGTEVGSGSRYAGSLGYQLTDSNDLFLGDYPGCTEHGFAGEIDEVMVVARALDRSEVDSIYDASTSLPPGGGQPAPGGGTPGAPGAGGSGAGTGPVTPGRAAGPPLPGEPSRRSPARGLPRIDSLRLSPSAFLDGPARTSAANGRTGTTVSYRDTQAATARFTVLIARRRGRCAPARRGRGRQCVSYIAIGSFVHGDRAGANRFRLARLWGRRLPPGAYELRVTPTAGHRTGLTVTTRFTVLP
jgi:hypothetical protein